MKKELDRPANSLYAAPDMKEVTKLSDTELNIRVAELNGYSSCEDRSFIGNELHPASIRLFGFINAIWEEVPDYSGDLNAMHEAEKVLTPEQEFWYGDALASLIRGPENQFFGDNPSRKFPLNGRGMFSIAHLSARQRAEAFVQTLT